ncbi:MAG: gliding motility-associated C-terminal domain-containing protein [Chitinophagales bacterium]
MAQSGNCDPITPFYVVNLDGDPNGTYISPQDSRKGNCCNTNFPDRCIEFEITLDQAAVGIMFDLYSGAVPQGAMYYQINCGPLVPVGNFICLSGPGPHTLTFCKPGNNPNRYFIQSLEAAYAVPKDSVRVGCTTDITISGFIESSIQWNDVTGDTVVWDSLLSCTTGCSNTSFSPVDGTPDVLNYQVCGYVSDSICDNMKWVCDTVEVSVFPELQVPPQDTVYYCITDGGTTIHANAYGGFGNLDYYWFDSNGNLLSSADSYFANQPGVYTLEIRDDLYPNCPADIQEIRLIPEQPATVDAGPDTLLCSQTSAIEIELNGTYQNAPGAYWSGGNGSWAFGDSVMNNSYSPTAQEISDNNLVLTLTTMTNRACPSVSDTKIIQFSNPPEIVIDNVSHITCNGANDGAMQTSTSLGIAPYTYLWTNGQTSEDASGLAAGTHIVEVTDSIGCTATDSAEILEPDPMTMSLFPQDLQCGGDSSGSLQSTVNGGIPPYSYQWSNGAATSDIANLAAGYHSLTVSDAYGCEIEDSAYVDEPNPIIVQENLRDISCKGFSDGEISVSVSGGFVPYTYEWSNGATNVNSIDSLIADDYSLTVTDPSGCQVIEDYTLIEAPTLLDTVIFENITCFGDSDGSIEVSASGGTPPYTFLWSSGNTSTIESNLSAGVYDITITDDNNCINETGIELIQPDSFTIVWNLSNVSCYNGSDGELNPAVTGGTPPYQYQWSTGSTQDSIQGLTEGNYSLTITDDHGCIFIADTSITQPDSLIISLSATDISCYGGNDGTITVTAQGGTTPYAFQWSNGSNSQNLQDLTAGIYSVTLTDTNGCNIIANIELFQPDSLSLSISKTDISCYEANDGNISLDVSGGTPAYSYQWNIAGTNDSVLALSAGWYSFTVSDQMNCEISDSIEITQPDSLQISMDGTHLLCPGMTDGQAYPELSGGTRPYSYSWDNGSTDSLNSNLAQGTYNLIVSDANNCEITGSHTINEMTIDLAQSDSGACVYELIILEAASQNDTAITSWTWDVNGEETLKGPVAHVAFDTSGIKTVQLITHTSMGCIDTSEIELTIHPEPVLTHNNDTLICPGASVELWASGASDYLWEMDSVTAASYVTTPTETTIHSITGYSSFGCITTEWVQIDLSPTPNPNLGPDTSLCLGATLPLDAGIWDTYTWHRGDSLSCTNCQSPQSVPQSTGTYIVEVANVHGCIGFDTLNVVINPTPGGINAQSSEACESVELTLEAEPGHPGYQWSPDSLISNADQQTIQVTLTDNTRFYLETTNQFGCVTIDSIDITVHKAPERSFSDNFTACPGDTTIVTLPNENLSTFWLPQQGLYRTNEGNLMTMPDTFRRIYLLSVDTNQCAYIDTLDINVHELPRTTLRDQTVFCEGSDVKLPLISTTNVTYSWSPSYNLNNPSIMQPTAENVVKEETYIVTVTSIDSCTVKDSIRLSLVDSVGIRKQTDLSVCRGEEISIGAPADSNGLEEVDYTWYDSRGRIFSRADTLHLSPQEAVTFKLIAESENCRPDTANFNVYVQDASHVRAGENIRVLSGEDVTLEAEGSSNATFAWFTKNELICDSCSSISFEAFNTQHYLVTSTEPNGCKSMDSVMVKIYTTCKDEVYVPNTFTPNKDGFNDKFYLRSHAPLEIKHFRIFDRWGKLVFETNSSYQGWDGMLNNTAAQIGVYTYYAELVCPNGFQEMVKGNVTLLR